MLHKEKTDMETSTAEHQEEGKRDDRHVPKVEGGLEHTAHATSVEVIEERICIDEQPGHSCVNEGTPPPSVIFPRQLEVEQRHTDKGRHNNEKGESEEKDTEEGVDLVSPHGSEDVVELDVNRREGQETGNDHLEWPAAVPGHLGGNLPRHLGRAGGRVEVVVRVVLGSDTPHHGQGEGDQGVERSDGEDGREGQRAGGPVG